MGKFNGFNNGGLGGLGNMQGLIKQAQKMQTDLAKKQEEVSKKIVETSSGGGAVCVKMSGDKQLLEIKIKEDVVDKEDVEMLQDLILTAVNEAINKTNSLMESELGSMNLKGMPGLF